MVDNRYTEYVKDNLGRFANEIMKLASQPSVSARKEGIEECSAMVEEMLSDIGATTKVLRLEGAAPLVYGELKSNRSSKTMLFYNHYDVQPEEPLELWRSPPFKPEVRDGRIYGRGVSDDKGELVSRVKIVETFLKTSKDLPCNVKFCFEGEEETGSVHLEDYVVKNPDLFKADGVIWEYGTVDLEDKPKVTLGVKGMIYVEFVVQSLKQDAHSSYAAALPSAPWRLVRLLNLIKDENERILVPGWYSGVETLSDEELKVLQEMPFDSEAFKENYGAGSLLGMTGEQAKKALIQRPTANIAGVWAGYTGPGSKTVLPKEIHAKMDFRLVPHQDPADLLKKLRKYLDDKGYADVKIVAESMEPAARTSYRDPFAQAAIKAAEKVYGKKPVVELSSPGTGPLYIFSRRYKMPSVDIGVSAEDGRIHAPNENLRLDQLQRGILWIAETMELFSAA